MLARRFHIETLGCAKNVADSDGIHAVLKQAGFKVAERVEDADILIVNTCGFLQSSRQESLQVLRSMGKRKEDGQLLIASGCLISRYGEVVQREVPEVDGVIDAGKWLAMPRLIEWLSRRGDSDKGWFDEAYLNLPPAQITARSVADYLPRAASGPSAFLKIADGCDRPCTFCIIPAIKGPHRSKPADDVVREARELVAHGVKEIVLVAQDTTAYGWDWGQRDQLAPLMERLCTEVDGLQWLRLMYAYPSHVTPRLIDTMARHAQILHYIDIPFQHAHPEVLKRMKRPNIIVTRKLLDDLRKAIPDIAIRTTFIVGFPGETEDEFASLLEFLEEERFDRVGVFEYSIENGTGAALLADQLPNELKELRRGKAMELQQRISLQQNQAMIGRTIEVLVEAVGALEVEKTNKRRQNGHERKPQATPNRVSIGRSYRDAPEVDGVVIGFGELPVGNLSKLKISEATEYDLVGVPEHGLN